MEKNVLIATLGETPEVIPEVVYKLAGEEIHFDKVIVLCTSETFESLNEDGGLNTYLSQLMGYKPTISDLTKKYNKTDNTPKFNYNGKETELPDEFIFVDMKVKDIDPTTETEVEKNIYYYILKAIQENTKVYVSIAGGRKTESAIGYAAGLFFGAEKILHVLLNEGVEEISAFNTPEDFLKSREYEKYGLVEMLALDKKISQFFNIAFKKRFYTDIKNIIPDDKTLSFTVKGEGSYDALQIIKEVSQSSAEIINTGLRSFINLGKALGEFEEIMQNEEEIKFYKDFAQFIENDILISKDRIDNLASEELGVNWKLRWLWGLNVYPEFVNHDIDHGGEVLRRASQIIKEFDIKLTPKEKLILALGAIFHDIGMTGYDDKFHWTEVREIHGILSALKIKDQEGKIFKVQNNLTREIWKAVRTICAFHDGNKFDKNEFDKNEKVFKIVKNEECELIKKADCFVESTNGKDDCNDKTTGYKIKDYEVIGSEEKETIRLNLLTSLLRLADACDMGTKMLMGETVKQLQIKWNNIGKNKAISLAKALLECSKVSLNKDIIKNELTELETIPTEGEKAEEGMNKAEKIKKQIKGDDLCSKELEEVLDRIVYFFKQSPKHYNFHEKIKGITIIKENGENKIIVNLSEKATEAEKVKAKEEAKERLEKETKILEKFGIKIFVELK